MADLAVSPKQSLADGSGAGKPYPPLRRQRLTGKHIALETGVWPATVSRIVRRARLSRRKNIKRPGRFERVGHRITGARKGQSTSRGVGWEYVHGCIGDAARIACTDIFPDEKAVSAMAFLKAALACYESRKTQLPVWTHRYNWHRPYGSLNSQPPISCLNLTEDNLLRLHS